VSRAVGRGEPEEFAKLFVPSPTTGDQIAVIAIRGGLVPCLRQW